MKLRSAEAPARCAGRTVALAAGLLVALAGCGSSNKKDKTTPGSTGTVTTTGMKDGKPVMGANVKTTTTGGGATGNGGGTTGNGATGNGGGAITNGTTAPALRPPVREPTEAEVKGELQRHIISARNALRQNDPNQAISSAKAALAVYSNSIDAVVLLAQAYYAKKLDDTGEVLLTMVLRDRAKKARAEKHAGLFYTLGLIYKRTGRDALAAKAFSKVVHELDSNHRGALMNLGAHHLENKVFAEAQKVFEKLVQTLKVQTAAAYNNLASAYRGRSADAALSSSQRDSLLKKAEYYYKKALFVDKNYANAVFNLGVLYLDADPFPFGRGSMPLLTRLNKAKAQFDDYQRLPGANQKKVTKLQKLVRKRIKKERKRLKKAKKKKKKRKNR